MVTSALMDLRTSQAMDRSRRHHTFAVPIHVSPILTRVCCGRTSEVVPILPFGSGASWLLTAGLFAGQRR